MLMLDVELPKLLDAVIMKFEDAEIIFGVPVIAPFVVFNINPEGKLGLTE